MQADYQKYEVKFIDVEDHRDANIYQYFQEAFQFIDKHRKQNKNVLVQCHAGVSRSATIIISYIMRKFQLNVDNAYKKLKEKRERVKPNQGFCKQLCEYSRSLIFRDISSRKSINQQGIYQYKAQQRPLSYNPASVSYNPAYVSFNPAYVSVQNHDKFSQAKVSERQNLNLKQTNFNQKSSRFPLNQRYKNIMPQYFPNTTKHDYKHRTPFLQTVQNKNKIQNTAYQQKKCFKFQKQYNPSVNLYKSVICSMQQKLTNNLPNIDKMDKMPITSNQNNEHVRGRCHSLLINYPQTPHNNKMGQQNRFILKNQPFNSPINIAFKLKQTKWPVFS